MTAPEAVSVVAGGAGAACSVVAAWITLRRHRAEAERHWREELEHARHAHEHDLRRFEATVARRQAEQEAAPRRRPLPPAPDVWELVVGIPFGTWCAAGECRGPAGYRHTPEALAELLAACASAAAAHPDRVGRVRHRGRPRPRGGASPDTAVRDAMRVHRTRITAALDAAGCEGARVDRVLGGAEPMVDEWEAGRLEPTPVQLLWLCDLTGVPPWWLLSSEPAKVTARVCPGFTPLFEIPPGADRDRARERLAAYRRLYRERAPLSGWPPR